MKTIKMKTIIDFLIKNKIKQADLRILQFFAKQKKNVKIGNIDKKCKINFYQVRTLVPKLEGLGLIEGNNKEGFKLNKNNELVEILFNELNQQEVIK